MIIAAAQGTEVRSLSRVLLDNQKSSAGNKSHSIQGGIEMKKLLTVIFVVCILMLGTTLVAESKASVQPLKGATAATICEGTPFAVTGIVVNIGIPGEGVIIDTGTSVVTIYGIGSLDYWAANNITRPAIGEVVTVTGYTVVLSDVTLNVAMSITVGGVTLQVRDVTTCVPLWRTIR
jgi:hypothetical protein